MADTNYLPTAYGVGTRALTDPMWMNGYFLDEGQRYSPEGQYFTSSLHTPGQTTYYGSKTGVNDGDHSERMIDPDGILHTRRWYNGGDSGDGHWGDWAVDMRTPDGNLPNEYNGDMAAATQKSLDKFDEYDRSVYGKYGSYSNWGDLLNQVGVKERTNFVGLPVQNDPMGWYDSLDDNMRAAVPSWMNPTTAEGKQWWDNESYDENIGYRVPYDFIRQFQHEDSGGIGQMMPGILSSLFLGGALGGYLPGVDAAGAAMAPGTTGLFSPTWAKPVANSLTTLAQGGTPSPTSFISPAIGESFPNLFDATKLSGGSMSWLTDLFGDSEINWDFESPTGADPAYSIWPGFIPGDSQINWDYESPTGADPAYSISPSMLDSLKKYLPAGTDLAKILGGIGSTALGYLGAEERANSLNETADKYLALGAPYRGLLASSYDPNFSMSKEPGYQDALDQSMQSYMRKASTGGNAFENPGVSTEALKYVTAGTALPALNTYRSQLGTFGQLGLNTAGTANLAGADASGGTYNALGYGLGQLTAPQNTNTAQLADLLKRLTTNNGSTV